MEFNERYYGQYRELCETGIQTICTKDINQSNIDEHFYSIINILKDGVETTEVQNMMIHVIFANNIDVDLTIFDYCINLMFWNLCTAVNHPINDIHLVFFDNITKRSIKEYIDNIFIDRYRTKIQFIDLNHSIDAVIGKFRDLRFMQMYRSRDLRPNGNFKVEA